MRITAVEDTDLFIGSATAPRQVVRVTLAGARPVPVLVRIEGPVVRTPDPVRVESGEAETTVEVGVVFAAPATEGGAHRVIAVAEPIDPADRREVLDAQITVAETGWTMWMVSHFHYDPVWWNTQAGFTETWLDLPGAQEKRMPFQLSAFDLVRAHLDAARQDEDYRFVLAEVDYLKPYWDLFPGDRADLGGLIREGRIELVGGNYNEAQTNLTHPESTVRNAVYGVGYQRDVLGADPRTAWMLDVFGHDPAYPGLMADAGLDSSVWARGPWHHVGAKRHTGDIGRMQFPSEFEWISPTGRGVLTGYLADHYVAGWDIERVDTLEESMQAAYKQFSSLRKAAATRNVLLPVGHDHNVPSRFCTQIHREWNARYVWPRFVVGTPREFFAAVRGDAAQRGTVFSPQTRDMNPVYSGKDVSYIDTKQAQRAAEVAVLDGERVATLAALLGARFPHEALDKAWRQLVYGAHHDAITGTESDQVYLDLVNGWREADELGREVLAGAISYVADHVNSTGGDATHPATAIITVNTLSFPRDAVTTVTVRLPDPGHRGLQLSDSDGQVVPAVTESLVRHSNGSIAELTLSFLARDVPALGYRIYHLLDGDSVPPKWTTRSSTAESTTTTTATIGNEFFLVEADPERGGALHRVLDLRHGRDLLRPGGLANELVLQAEHRQHPVWEEGPWHLLPKGPGLPTGAAPAIAVHVETSPIGERIVAATTLRGLRITQQTTLWHGVPRVDLRTHVDGSIGQDHLLRARFDLDVPGALPVAEVGFAAVGRSFGFPEADAAEDLWTLDSPAHTWAGLSAPARIVLRSEASSSTAHAIGIAEVIEPAQSAPFPISNATSATASALTSDLPARTRALLAALVAKGVTATCTRADGERYGALDADSNLPDVRIALGTDSAFAQEVLDSAGPEYRVALAAHGRVFIPASRTRREQWKPGADLRGARDLPVLIVDGRDGSEPHFGLAAAVDSLIDDLADATVEVTHPTGLPGTTEPADDYSIAVVNQGTPGFVIDTDGRLHVSLMRSCSGWPVGVWIDGERRTVPDGSSFAWQHWSHTFELSLLAGAGDWRSAGFTAAAQEVSHPIRAAQVQPGPGDLPPVLGLIEVSPREVLLTAAKPAGNPLASGAAGDPDPDDAISLRIYETTGTPTTATVTVHGGLLSAERTDLLEERVGEQLDVSGGAARVDLGPSDVATLWMEPSGVRVRSNETSVGLNETAVRLNQTTIRSRKTNPAELARTTEPVQPVHTRYWLHNAGPAPLGNLPTSVHVSPTRLRLTADDRGATLTVTVSCSGRPATGQVELDVPPGLIARLPEDLHYRLAPGEHAEFTVPVRASDRPGRYLLAARIRDDLRQTLEDAVEVSVSDGQVPEGHPTDTLADGTPADLFEVHLDAEAIELAPGATADLPVILLNRASSEIRGEVTLISPYGTWDGELSIGPRAQPFALAAGEKARLNVTAHAAANARVGSHWWALVRVTGHGRLHYSPAIEVRITEPGTSGH